MKEEHSDLVKEHFEMKYYDYDKLIRNLIPKYEEMHNIVIDSFNLAPKEKARLLDLGIGSGETALLVLERFPNAKIEGYDIAKNMIEQAKVRLKNHSTKVLFHNKDISKSDFIGRYDCVFVKPEDDEDKMKKKFISLFPFDLEKEKIVLQQSKATGFNQRKVIILEVDLEKERHTRSFLESFVSKLNDQQKTMLVSQDNRIDDECNFFLRLDKQKLLDDEFWITDSGECFHVKINIAAFPKKKEKAKDVVKEIFS